LQIADQLERGRLTDRQLAGLGSAQDTVDVPRRLPEKVARLRAVPDERAARE
jgi:hypothetical protein